ncbi:MAG: thioredoxin-like domain-containing protein [Nibricoccus sp.]
MKFLKSIAIFSAFFAIVSQVSAGQIADATKGKLVRLSDDKVAAAAGDALAGKELIAIYYSAHWCPPCRAFTPKLVEFYNENKTANPKFELIFVSSDKSASQMEEYMSGAKMPWLALKYDERGLALLRKHAARGIPYLIVLDADGNELIAKDQGQDWRSPTTVLPELKKLLQK